MNLHSVPEQHNNDIDSSSECPSHISTEIGGTMIEEFDFSMYLNTLSVIRQTLRRSPFLFDVVRPDVSNLITCLFSNKTSEAEDMIKKMSVNALNISFSGDTLLTYAIVYNNPDIAIQLLNAGANPEGITVNGYTKAAPISEAYRIANGDDFTRLITHYTLCKGDINAKGLSEKTLLYNLCEDLYIRFFRFKQGTEMLSEKFVSTEFQKYWDRISFILSKGADPNASQVYIPLITLYESYQIIQHSILRDIILLLLLHGADIYMCNDTRVSVHSIMDRNMNHNIIFINDPVRSIINRNIKKVTKIDVQLLKLACIITKVPYKKILREKIRKDLTKYECLEMTCAIRLKFKETVLPKNHNYQSFCVNSTLLNGDSLDVYMPEELAIVDFEKKMWCFHVSEIPHLLKSRKNPYTGSIFPESLLASLNNINKHIRPISLSEYIEQHKTRVSSHKAYNPQNALSEYIKAYTPYISIEPISEFNLPTLKNLYSLINSHLPVHIIPRSADVFMSSNEHRKLLLSDLLNFLLINIRQQSILVPTVTHLLEQVISDHLIITELRNCFSEDEISFMKNAPFGMLIFILNEEKYENLKNILHKGRSETDMADFWWNLREMF